MWDGVAALVGVDWLARALRPHIQQPHMLQPHIQPTHPQPIVLHAEWSEGGARSTYADGHIPGALSFDTDWLENGYPTWQLLPAVLLQRRFGDVGVRATDTIVVYAQQYAAACRVWWVLRYCGATDVRVLCGGLNAWCAAGLPVATTPAERIPTAFSAGVQSALLADSDAVQSAAQMGRLIDVRSSDEYRGLRSGYSYLQRVGRIPGALHADAEPLTALLDCADLPGIAAYWQACGVLRATDAQPGACDASAALVFYCGSGWRSSVACFCAQLLGMHDARNYSDGWCGWSTRYVRDTAEADIRSGDGLPSDQPQLLAGSTPGWRQLATGKPIATG